MCVSENHRLGEREFGETLVEDYPRKSSCHELSQQPLNVHALLLL